MQSRSEQPDGTEKQNQAVFSQAIVIGGSIAGLTAARVLAEHVARVIVVERDQHTDAPGARSGVPQAHHPHNLQPQGQQMLERLFPGVTEELIAEHAVSLGQPDDVTFHYDGSWHTAAGNGRQTTLSCSHNLLEQILHNGPRGDCKGA